jgi:DNA-binding protein HU-beta
MRLSRARERSKVLAIVRSCDYLFLIQTFDLGAVRVSGNRQLSITKTGGTVNKTELQETLASEANLSKADAARAVDALFGTGGVIAGELKKGGKVQITGFGSFVVRQRAARTGRDPRTGQALQIAAANVPAFKAGQALKDALN